MGKAGDGGILFPTCYMRDAYYINENGNGTVRHTSLNFWGEVRAEDMGSMLIHVSKMRSSRRH